MNSTSNTNKGRPARFGRPLTSVERMTMNKQKNRFLAEEMKAHGYVPTVVYLHPAHIKAIELIEGAFGNLLTAHHLSAWIWRGIRKYFEAMDLSGDSLSDQALKKLISSDEWPDVTFHEVAGLNAAIRTQQWAESEFGNPKE